MIGENVNLQALSGGEARKWVKELNKVLRSYRKEVHKIRFISVGNMRPNAGLYSSLKC